MTDMKLTICAFGALMLAACGASGAGEAAPESGTAPDAATAEAAPASAPAADPALAALSGEWRCKAQDNIPIGILKVAASGAYEFTVVSNTVWDPKPGDSGNGTGEIGIQDGAIKPLSGPLVTAYEIVDIGRTEDQWGIKTYFNNSFGTLLVCAPASDGG
jgi:hypothetical protein